MVANLALIDLDRLATEEFKPLYYGRYIDDILLVLEDDENLRTVEGVWQWLEARSHGALVTSSDGDQLSVRFHVAYLGESEIELGNRTKNRVFHLSGATGRFVLGSIRRAIDEQASRWQQLPAIPSDSRRIGTDIAVATTETGEATTTLRDADHITARRAAFAVRLRDFEAYERDLDVDSWAEHRAALFASITEQLLVPPTYFAFAGYVPRLIKLAAACGDMGAIEKMLSSLARIFHAVIESREGERRPLAVKEFSPPNNGANHESNVGDWPRIAELWREQLVREAFESLAAGLASSVRSAVFTKATKSMALLGPEIFGGLTPQAVRRLHAQLFVRDLAHVPYRFRWLAPDFAPRRGIPSLTLLDRYASSVTVSVEPAAERGYDLLLRRLDEMGRPSGGSTEPQLGSEVPGLVFSTRPVSMLELYLLLHGTHGSVFGLPPKQLVQTVLLALRGNWIDGALPGPRTPDGRVLDVGAHIAGGRRRIALAMIETTIDCWAAAASGRPILSRERYESLIRPLNELIARPAGAHYVLLPELSVPSTWFVRLARRLQHQHIDLIAGIEYRRGQGRTVYNQAWSALRVDGLGFPALVVLRQDKQRPAPGEETRLYHLVKKRLAAETAWSEPPVVSHGGFAFSILICSELTNIAYRTSLRGEIDALLVPEWNRDLHSFEALVESSALDIHAFIAQANHRSYGDSRIRSPRDNEWERDVVRLRGGVHDYVVVGEVDFFELRAFQSSHRVPDGPFKPLPDGFEPARWRRRRPMPTRE